MARKKQKKDQSGPAGTGGKAKAGGAKLPKRIAGVKVPKPLRGPGGRLLEAVTNPLVMDIAAAALMAAAGRLRDEAAKAAASTDGAAGHRAGPGKPAADLGTILAGAAVEGIRKITESTRPARPAKGRPTRARKDGGGGS